MRNIAQLLQRVLLDARFMIIIAVVCGILSAFMMVILGSYNVVEAFIKLIQLFNHFAQAETIEKYVVTSIISAVDEYLIATVLLIFSIGLYELFISKLDYGNEGKSGPQILVIHDLDQLKENLAKVIIIVLIVTYFKYALEIDYRQMIELLYLSVGIFLIALSLFFISHKHKEKDKPRS